MARRGRFTGVHVAFLGLVAGLHLTQQAFTQPDAGRTLQRREMLAAAGLAAAGLKKPDMRAADSLQSGLENQNSQRFLEQVSSIPSAWPVLLLTFFVAVLLGYVYLAALRHCASVLIWLVMAFSICSSAFLGVYLWANAADLSKHLPPEVVPPEGFGKDEETATKVVAVLCWVVCGVAICIGCCCHASIQAAVDCIEAACEAIYEMSSLLLAPIFKAVAQGTFDSDSLGSRLLDRSGLSHHDQRMVLVGTQQSLDLEAIAECLVLQWPEFRPAPPVVGKDGPSKGKGKGTATSSSSSTPSTSHTSVTTKGGSKGKRQAFITQRSHAEETIDEEAEEFADALEEADAGQMDEDERPQEEEPEEPSEDVDLGALAEVLTVTARKLSGATLGRKFSAGGKKKKSPDELRKVTHCAACGALGHWHQDPSCPMNQGKPGSGGKAFGKGSQGSSSTYRAGPASEKKGGKTHQVSMVHHERGATDITSPEEFGSLFSTFMVTTPFMVTEVKRESDMMGFMVLDSACQRTCCGQQWYDLHKKFLGNHFMKCKEVPTHDVYQFGKGDPTTSSIQAYIPVFFKDIPILIGVGILPENIPLLGGNTLLDTLGSVIDLPSRTVHFTKIGCSVKSKPKAKPTAAALLRQRRIRDMETTDSQFSGWTNFRAGYTLHTDHLTEAQQREVFNILEQDSPLTVEPTTVAEYAFLNEESFKEQRKKMETAADRSTPTRAPGRARTIHNARYDVRADSGSCPTSSIDFRAEDCCGCIFFCGSVGGILAPRFVRRMRRIHLQAEYHLSPEDHEGYREVGGGCCALTDGLQVGILMHAGSLAMGSALVTVFFVLQVLVNVFEAANKDHNDKTT
eukprot:g21719.t1